MTSATQIDTRGCSPLAREFMTRPDGQMVNLAITVPFTLGLGAGNMVGFDEGSGFGFDTSRGGGFGCGDTSRGGDTAGVEPPPQPIAIANNQTR